MRVVLSWMSEFAELPDDPARIAEACGNLGLSVESIETVGSNLAGIVVGKVLESEPPTRLVITFEDSLGESRDPSVVTFLVEPHEEIVRLTVTHERLPNEEMRNGISSGWPAVLANLKSLLETGDVLPQAPWEMSAAHA